MVRNASQYLQYSAEHSSNVFSGSVRSQHNGDSTADRPIYNLKYPLLQRITVVWGSRAEPYSSWRLYKPPCFDCSIAGDLYLYTSNRRLVSISVMQLSCLKAYAKQCTISLITTTYTYIELKQQDINLWIFSSVSGFLNNSICIMSFILIRLRKVGTRNRRYQVLNQ